MRDNPFLLDYASLEERPPETLYKYVVPERVDILKHRRIRLTPLNGTNDIFEVRRMFRKFAGPVLQAVLLHDLGKRDLVEALANKAAREFGISLDQGRQFVMTRLPQVFGQNYLGVMQLQMEDVLAGELEVMSDEQQLAGMLEEYASNTLMLSLTEEPCNEVMWGLYAESGRGFLIGLDTHAAFFRSSNGGTRLLKVNYVDEPVHEFFENPAVALCSKTSRWAYEQEWRMMSAIGGESETVIAPSGERVHLFDLPAATIRSITIGPRSSPSIRRELQQLGRELGADVFDAIPNLRTGRIEHLAAK